MDEEAKQEHIRRIIETRNESRPDIDLVVRTIDAVFERLGREGLMYEVGLRGPEAWTWTDYIGEKQRRITLTRSVLEGAEGHPLLCIAVNSAPRLDAWLSVSGLVIGTNAQEIENNFSMAIMNHQGAWGGLMDTIINSMNVIADRADSTPVEKSEMN